MGYKYPVRQRRRLKADNEQQEAILKKGQGEITVATVSAGACNVPTQIWGGGGGLWEAAPKPSLQTHIHM